MGRRNERDINFQAPNHRGRRIACRKCRQAKIRCEWSTGRADLCSRCQRLGQDCQIDTEFKRVNKRAKLEELEQEVRQLRSSVSGIPRSTPPLILGESSSNRSLDQGSSTMLTSEFSLPAQTPMSGEMPRPHGRYRSHYPTLDFSSPTQPRTLDHLTLSPQQIDSLFHLYFKKYHPPVPLLDPTIPPNNYYDRSPLLFWTVVYISSRQYAEEPGLLGTLTSPLKQLLWGTISNPPHTWYLVQSMLLFCMWPFPTSSLWNDTTPMLVNLAQTIAMQLGLHQPEAIQDFSRTKQRLTAREISEVVKTWSICYIASQSMTTIYGLAWPSSDWMIDRICDQDCTYMVPENMKHQLLIYRFSARVSNYTSKGSSAPNGLPRTHDSLSILALLEQEFFDLARSLEKKITADNDVLLNGTGLQLYVFYLLDSGSSTSRKIALLRAFDIAKTLIANLRQLDTTSNFMKHCPASYFRVTSLAALFILKLQDSNYAELLDVESGKRAFNAALFLLRQASLEDSDLPGRTSNILAQLWSRQGHSKQSGEEPRLRLRTRLSASLLHDQLWSWRESFGGQVSASHTPPADNIGAQSMTTLPDGGLIAPPPEEGDVDRLTFEEVFDTEILSLLPFDLEADASLNPLTSFTEGVPSPSKVL